VVGRKQRAFWNQKMLMREIINHVIKIIENISYKGVILKKILFVELDIVQDADRLDAWSYRNCSDV
jgi:uncharacterized protein